MDILNMFNNIEIKNTNRLGGEDLEFCELQERIYNKVYKIYEDLTQSIQELQNNDIKELNEKFNYSNGSSYNGTFTNAITFGHHNWDMKDNINKLSSNMVSGITSYFSHKYKVEIDYEKIKKLAEDKKIDYNFVVDLIFEQLGGFSFEDKAKQQIIDKLKKETIQYREDKKKIIVKNNKVTINSYLYCDSWDKNQLSYHSYEQLENLFNAVNSFCNNEQNSEYIKKLYNTKYFGEYDLNFSQCTSTKFYKNGKVDLVFSNGIKALEFANEYTNYAVN